MIKEAYCSYEVSELLKKKGFDEPCIRHWDCDDYSLYGANDIPISNSELRDNEYNGVSAPTHQMAMKWLREIHNIFILIEPHSYNYIEEKNSSYVFSFWLGDNYCENPLLKEYYSYEDAVEAALKYCLENLI